MNKAELLSKYESNLAGSKNKNHYLSYARAFVDYADSLDKENVDNYIKKLKRQGKAPGTLNFAFRVVRRLFAVNGLEWPFRRGEAPEVTGDDKPGLSPNIIKVMIDAAKNNDLSCDEACFLAISTIYAVRREELCRVRPKHLNYKSNLIFIDTIKGGRKRWHSIPPEIMPYLKNHDFSHEYSVTAMSQMFWRIVNKCKVEELKNERAGWHNIRTSVVTLLHRSGLDPFLVHAFMRWRGAEKEFAMDVRYDATSWIDLDGKTVIAKEAQSDKEVFKKHPVLKLWR